LTNSIDASYFYSDVDQLKGICQGFTPLRDGHSRASYVRPATWRVTKQILTASTIIIANGCLSHHFGVFFQIEQEQHSISTDKLRL
jgi:hypothetical protein